MSSQERQDQLLRRIVAADDAASDAFFTASSNSGSILFHDGFAEPGHQIVVGVQDIKNLSARGLLAITELREYGDVAFVVTPAGRAEAERLERGGKTEAETQRERAELAEASLQRHLDEDARQARAVETQRARTASRLATVPAVLVALAVGIAVYVVSQSGQAAAAMVAILGILGVAVSWLYVPLRERIARLLMRPLRFIHDHT